MTRQTPAATSREDVADAFITVSRALVAIAVRSINAAPVEVTLTQHRLLVLLATGGDQTVKTLAERLKVNGSNASRLCDRLQRLGLLARDRSPNDGREVVVSLTADGRELLDAVRTHRRHDVQQVLSQMSRTNIEAAITALTAFGDAAHEIGEPVWVAYAL